MSTLPDVSHEVSLADKGMDRLVAGAPYSGHRISNKAQRQPQGRQICEVTYLKKFHQDLK
jgi:hypothetical protein